MSMTNRLPVLFPMWETSWEECPYPFGKGPLGDSRFGCTRHAGALNRTHVVLDLFSSRGYSPFAEPGSIPRVRTSLRSGSLEPLERFHCVYRPVFLDHTRGSLFNLFRSS